MDDLEAFTDSLWIATTPTRLAGAWFPHVMTVVRLRDGALLLHSPCRPSPALYEQLAALGDVRHIVAPNWFHDLYLAEYRAAYPQATFWGPRFLRRLKGTGLIDRTLEDDTPPPWHEELEHHVMRGLLTLDESLFLHVPTRTAIVADLLMNLFAGAGSPFFTRMAYRVSGMQGRLGVFSVLRWSRFVYGAQLRQAAAQLLAWAPERLIVGHGRPIDANATERLRSALGGLSRLP